MALQRVPLNNFRGGLNTRDSPFELQPNESPDLLNVTISALVGQLETRKGKIRLDTAGMPAGSVDNAHQVVIGNGKRFLMLSISGSVYRCNPAGEVAKLFAGTAGTIWDFEVYANAAFKDWVYMGNGVDAMQKWDGEAAATVEWKATAGVLPKGGVVCVWENRMFISYVSANVQRIYFSEFGDPEATIKEYGFVDVRGPEDDLDAIQDLCVLGARLIVLKRRSVFFISSAVTMLNRRIGGPGVWARFQTVELENKLYFFNPQGIFSTGGVDVLMESGSITNYFPQKLNASKAEVVRLVATKDTYPRLLIAMPIEGSETNNILIEMVPHINFRRIGGRRYLLLPAFMLHTIAATALACWNPTGAEELIACSSAGIWNPAEFPEQGVTDSFNRAEEVPLSNGGKWTLWGWLFKSTMGAIRRKGGAGPFGWENGGENLVEGGRWNVAEFPNPQTSIEMFEPPETTAAGAEVKLFSCFAAAVQSGYEVRMIYEEFIAGKAKPFQPPRWRMKFQIIKWVAGVSTELFHTEEEFQSIAGCKLGCVVNGGKVQVWFYAAGSGSWVLVGEVADATYNKGYSGFTAWQFGGVGVSILGQLRNFSVNAVGTLSKLSKIFKGETDEGTLIQAHWQSAWMAIQGEEPKERLRRLNVELSGDVIVDVFKDFEAVAAFTQTLPKVGELGEYEEPPGEGLAYRFSRVRPETRGRFHSVRFRTDAEGEPFLINTAELVIRGGKEH